VKNPPFKGNKKGKKRESDVKRVEIRAGAKTARLGGGGKKLGMMAKPRKDVRRVRRNWLQLGEKKHSNG